MNADDVLVIADVICDEFGATIRSMPALVAVAAVTSAQIGGVELYRSRGQRNRAIVDTIMRLEPLTSSNEEFAAVLSRVVSALER